MDTLTALRTRRAVRKYTDDPVNPEDLETILDCGRYAPCGTSRAARSLSEEEFLCRAQ